MKYKFLKGILSVLAGGMLFFSCENDLETITTITATDQTPDEVVNDMHTLYLDSGIVVYEIIASRMEKFTTPKEKTIFKNGFEVNFYENGDSLISKLTADYAEILELQNKIIARNNVIFTNYQKKQTLETEELYWDQRIKRVRTDKSFHIIGEDTELWGYGMDTDESFTDYNAHKVRVEANVENDTISK